MFIVLRLGVLAAHLLGLPATSATAPLCWRQMFEGTVDEQDISAAAHELIPTSMTC